MYKYRIVNAFKYMYHSSFRKKKIFVLSNNKKAIIIGVCEGINVGDHAIAEAQKKFVNRYFDDFDCYEISIDEYWRLSKSLRTVIKENDIIFIQGGGNLGNEYLLAEDIRRNVIKRFNENLIINFPSTIFFKENIYGKLELKKSMNIYRKAKSLILLSREYHSYELSQTYFNNNMNILIPDIVFTLKVDESKKERQDVIFTFRNDNESVLNNALKTELIEKVQNFYNISCLDTCTSEKISISDRKVAIRNIIDQYKSSKIVVTDRLHGMILSIITETPCIVFTNYNHKISSTFDLVKKHVNFVEMYNPKEDILTQIDRMLLINPMFKQDLIVKQYDQLAILIKNTSNRSS